MAQTIAQHNVASFTTPVNGTSPIDANTVRGNDNTLRVGYNDHDSDSGIHVQSSLLASRPSAGDAGRKWLTTDSGAIKLYFDTGSAWAEISYLPLAGGTVAGNVSITGTLGVTNAITATGGVVGNVTGNASTATALATARTINGVSFDGTANITVTADAGTLTGSTLASGVTASSLTSVGTLANLTVTNPITGSVTGSSGSTTGNAATATALQTARTINGTSFNGTANITVTAAAGTLTGTALNSTVTGSSLTSVGTLTAGAIGTGFTAIPNTALANSSVTVNGTAIALGASGTVAAAAGTLTGSTLASGVTASSLTSVGTLSSLAVSGNVTVDTNTLFVDATNNRVAVGTTSPLGSLSVQSVNGSVGFNFGTSVSPQRGNLWYDTDGSGWHLSIGKVQSGTFTEQIRLNDSGNLGVGVTPSAWNAGYRALEFGSGAALWAENSSNSNIWVSANTTLDSGGAFRYKTTAAATAYNLQTGIHRWYTAPSGTAGNAITFTQAMTLDANGQLGIGITSPTSRLHVRGSGTNTFLTIGDAGANHNILLGTQAADVAQLASFNTTLASGSKTLWLTASDMVFNTWTGSVYNTRMVLHASGGFSIGNATDPGSGNLIVNGWVRASSASAGAASTTTIGNGTATTVGATGAAAALPANPLGYIIAHVGTTQVKIPYYTA